MATKIHYKELSGNKKKKDDWLIINNSKGLEINRKVITFRYKTWRKYSPISHHS